MDWLHWLLIFIIISLIAFHFMMMASAFKETERLERRLEKYEPLENEP